MNKGFSLIECIVTVAIFTLVVAALLSVWRGMLLFEKEVQQKATASADMIVAMEMILREAREGQTVYGEILPKAPVALVIQDSFQGRLRQIRYRLSVNDSGSYSLLREIAYPGITTYQGHNPIAREIASFQLKKSGNYLEITLEDADGQTLSRGVMLRNLN